MNGNKTARAQRQEHARERDAPEGRDSAPGAQERRAGVPGARQGQDQARVTAAEWFAGGRRIPYDPQSGRVLTEHEAAAAPDALRVFERTAAADAGRGPGMAHIAARIPGRLLRLGPGGPAAR